MDGPLHRAILTRTARNKWVNEAEPAVQAAYTNLVGHVLGAGTAGRLDCAAEELPPRERDLCFTLQLVTRPCIYRVVADETRRVAFAILTEDAARIVWLDTVVPGRPRIYLVPLDG